MKKYEMYPSKNQIEDGHVKKYEVYPMNHKEVATPGRYQGQPGDSMHQVKRSLPVNRKEDEQPKKSDKYSLASPLRRLELARKTVVLQVKIETLKQNEYYLEQRRQFEERAANERSKLAADKHSLAEELAWLHVEDDLVIVIKAEEAASRFDRVNAEIRKHHEAVEKTASIQKEKVSVPAKKVEHVQNDVTANPCSVSDEVSYGKVQEIKNPPCSDVSQEEELELPTDEEAVVQAGAVMDTLNDDHYDVPMPNDVQSLQLLKDQNVTEGEPKNEDIKVKSKGENESCDVEIMETEAMGPMDEISGETGKSENLLSHSVSPMENIVDIGLSCKDDVMIDLIKLDTGGSSKLAATLKQVRRHLNKELMAAKKAMIGQAKVSVGKKNILLYPWWPDNDMNEDTNGLMETKCCRTRMKMMTGKSELAVRLSMLVC